MLYDSAITSANNFVEAIGGIVGLNSNASTSISPENQGLFNVSSAGALTAAAFNNVGGAIGNNQSKLDNSNALSSNGDLVRAQFQVFVTGNNNVGGAVGTNSGTIAYATVENIKVNNTEKVLVTGSANVGGIVGKMTAGSLTSSSFISYVATSVADVKAIVAEKTGGSVQYVVSYANGTLTTDSSLTTLEALEEDGNYKFIYTPAETIDLQLTTEGEKYKMEAEDGNLSLYLFYHKANSPEGDNEYSFSNLLTVDAEKSLKISISFSSSNSGILTIENGTLVVNSTGFVELVAETPYISAKQTIYVYVVNYANGFGGYLDSFNSANLSGEKEFDASENHYVYFEFLKDFNQNGYAIPKDIKVMLKVEETTIKPGQSYKDIFTWVQISPSAYQIATNNKVAKDLKVEFIPYIEFVGADGKTYTSRAVSGLSEISFTISFVNSTKSLEVSKSSITTEPYYTTSVDVTFNSLNENEKLTILILDQNGNIVEDHLDITAVYNGKTIDLADLKINCLTNNIVTIYFKMDESGRLLTESETYIVRFTSENGKTADLSLTYEPQEIFSINPTLYPIVSQEEKDKYGFTEEFSYIPSGVVVPGQNSLIEFKINPGFTYFETIEIVNVASNEYNLLFDLYDRTTNSLVAGAKNITNGISVNKTLVENGHFMLRTFVDQRTSDNSTLSILIILKGANGKQIGEAFEKTFHVEQLPGVVVTVDGVSGETLTNTEANPLKLAQGITYDMDVWVKGYNFGAYNFTEGLITDGQVVFEIVGNKDLISIAKSADGSYELVVSGNSLSGSRKVEIHSYGINAKGERSKESILYIEIVQFVVKTGNVGDIISGVVDNIYSSATGNTLTLEISLNSNILIYDKTNANVSSSVANFLNSLSTGVVNGNSVWSFNEMEQGWQNASSLTDERKTGNGTFTLSYNNGKFVIKFVKTETSSAPTLQVKFNASFFYNESGVPTLLTNEKINSYELSQTITFDISEKTSLRNPYPIYNAEQLLDMREGNYYILMNDITDLPDNFKPITTLIGGLDGNNYKIVIPNMSIRAEEEAYNLTFGLFQTTSEDAILKNIILYVEGSVQINVYNYSSVTYGLLVAENNGQITNCSIEGPDLSIINLNLYGKATSTTVDSNVGGLVATNYGNITNCRVEVGLAINSVQNKEIGYLPANVAGLVSDNRGTIVSSYVKARVENNTAGSTAAITAGLVAENQMGSRIFASYVSGTKTFPTQADNPFTMANIVYSTAKASAFVYLNGGEISNCYSNIPVRANEGTSGFVYQNQEDGNISYCYSTSALESSAKNGSFIGVLTGVIEGENPILNSGTLYQCYSWSEGTGINSGLGTNANVEGLKLIDKGTFSARATFVEFAFSTTTLKTDGVWFWANGEGILESDFLRNGKGMSFSSLAPQLVSPNIISAGHQELKEQLFDEESQTTIYVYWDDADYQEGTKYNPYIIATEEDLEFLVSSQSGFTNGAVIGNVYCRLISDIIYESSTISSGLYKYSFTGSLEGNSYTIGNYGLDSSENMENGGFFATIGTKNNHGGTIKNLNFAPKYISLTNGKAVGAVAGSMFGSTLVNITIDGYLYSVENSGVTIVGKNAVGGVVGVAEGQFNMNNISSNISVNSTYRAELNGHSTEQYKGIINKVSYSGLIAGVVNGYGKASYIKVFGENVSVAEHASLVFGHVGKNVVASTITATGNLNQTIKADVYGGVVAAHNMGTLEHITITGVNSPSYNGFFASDAYVPNAIGNIVGLMTSGRIYDVNVKTKLKANGNVNSLGGAVGQMVAGTLENITIEGDITGGSRIGGIVGHINNETANYSIEINNCIYLSGNILSNSSSNFVAVGTIIGYVSNYDGNIIGTKITITSATLNNETPNVNVRVINYSTSPSTEIWIAPVVTLNNLLQKGAYVNETMKPHNANVNASNFYIPLTSSYKIYHYFVEEENYNLANPSAEVSAEGQTVPTLIYWTEIIKNSNQQPTATTYHQGELAKYVFTTEGSKHWYEEVVTSGQAKKYYVEDGKVYYQHKALSNMHRLNENKSYLIWKENDNKVWYYDTTDAPDITKCINKFYVNNSNNIYYSSYWGTGYEIVLPGQKQPNGNKNNDTYASIWENNIKIGKIYQNNNKIYFEVSTTQKYEVQQTYNEIEVKCVMLFKEQAGDKKTYHFVKQEDGTFLWAEKTE